MTGWNPTTSPPFSKDSISEGPTFNVLQEHEHQDPIKAQNPITEQHT